MPPPEITLYRTETVIASNAAFSLLVRLTDSQTSQALNFRLNLTKRKGWRYTPPTLLVFNTSLANRYKLEGFPGDSAEAAGRAGSRAYPAKWRLQPRCT